MDPDLVEAALSVFVELPPVQRSAIILKDVLGQSLEDSAKTMGTSVGAVKAALSRARLNISRTNPHALPKPLRLPTAEERATLQRYVEFFNDRNWAALRAQLGEEARLDIVSRIQQRAATAGYYERYSEITKVEDIRAEAGFVDGIAAIAMFRPPSSSVPAYFILLESTGGRVSLIRDFRYIPYIAADARFSPLVVDSRYQATE